MNTTEVWKRQLKELYSQHELIIREQPVRELVASQTITSLHSPFVDDPVRNVSDAFRYAEAYWILSGDNKADTIAPYAPSIRRFSDNGIYFQGAYGPKVTEQLNYVVETLYEDTASRQAVISIWRESPRQSKDIPCTLSLQFLIRDNIINCVATMRSSDIWLGWVYDVFNFSCITEWVRLKYENESDLPHGTISRGKLYLNMGSSHLYCRNAVAAANVLRNTVKPTTIRTLPLFFSTDELMQWLKSQRDLSHEA